MPYSRSLAAGLGPTPPLHAVIVSFDNVHAILKRAFRAWNFSKSKRSSYPSVLPPCIFPDCLNCARNSSIRIANILGPFRVTGLLDEMSVDMVSKRRSKGPRNSMWIGSHPVFTVRSACEAELATQPIVMGQQHQSAVETKHVLGLDAFQGAPIVELRC